MLSNCNTIRRSISTTAVLNKRQPIQRRLKFVFDPNNNKIEDAIDYHKDYFGIETKKELSGKEPTSYQKAVEKRRKLFGDALQPVDYYTYLTNVDISPPKSSKVEEKDKPHFSVGEKNVYLPEGAITLLPNLPNMSPYYARFKVPRTYNKLDLRDYLFHLYGLKVFDMRVSLSRRKFLPQKNNRGHFLSSQEKVIVVRMEKPFIWPTIISSETVDANNRTVMKDYRRYVEDAQQRIGSDFMKPCPDHIFEGVGGQLEPLPQPFISKNVYKKWTEEIKHNRDVNNDAKLDDALQNALKKLDINENDNSTITGDNVKQIE